MRSIVKLLVLTGLGLLFVNCTSDDDSSNSDTDITEAQSLTETGTWRVSEFNDSGQDETSDFAGYLFSFRSDGNVAAVRNEITVSGTWSIEDDSNSSSDNSDDDLDFNLNFAVGSDSDFEDLNDDWDILSISSSQIRLRDVSGGDGSIDILTFVKN